MKHYILMNEVGYGSVYCFSNGWKDETFIIVRDPFTDGLLKTEKKNLLEVPYDLYNDVFWLNSSSPPDFRERLNELLLQHFPNQNLPLLYTVELDEEDMEKINVKYDPYKNKAEFECQGYNLGVTFQLEKNIDYTNLSKDELFTVVWEKIGGIARDVYRQKKAEGLIQ